MKFDVELHEQARFDLQDAFHWAAARAPETAERWLDRFEEALQSLSTFPERHGLAAEATTHGREIRELHFGKRPNVFRVLYLIDGEKVRVARIIRSSRMPLGKDEIEQR